MALLSCGEGRVVTVPNVCRLLTDEAVTVWTGFVAEITNVLISALYLVQALSGTEVELDLGEALRLSGRHIV